MELPPEPVENLSDQRVCATCRHYQFIQHPDDPSRCVMQCELEPGIPGEIGDEQARRWGCRFHFPAEASEAGAKDFVRRAAEDCADALVEFLRHTPNLTAEKCWQASLIERHMRGAFEGLREKVCELECSMPHEWDEGHQGFDQAIGRVLELIDAIAVPELTAAPAAPAEPPSPR